jgi:hypothetical protein
VRSALHGLILLAPTSCHGRAPVVVGMNRCGWSGDIGAMVSYIFTYRDSRTIRML